MPNLLLIDNYDSFTWNVVQALSGLGAHVDVVRHDEVSVPELAARRPQGIVLSPGPGNPDQSGICLEAVEHFAGALPILGICLGHQVIAQHFGGRIVRAERILHGHATPIHHRGQGLFEGLPSPFYATRYHSLVVDPTTLPEALEVTAWTEGGAIMGLRHRTIDVEGVQFHPESFLTESGDTLLANFLARVCEAAA